MRHDERHAALAAYAFWCKLEHTGTDKYPLRHYYELLFNHVDDENMCPACTVVDQQAKREGLPATCKNCPCEWGSVRCFDDGSQYWAWAFAIRHGRDARIFAGDIANIMRKWCERVGVIAPREVVE